MPVQLHAGSKPDQAHGSLVGSTRKHGVGWDAGADDGAGTERSTSKVKGSAKASKQAATAKAQHTQAPSESNHAELWGELEREEGPWDMDPVGKARLAKALNMAAQLFAAEGGRDEEEGDQEDAEEEPRGSGKQHGKRARSSALGGKGGAGAGPVGKRSKQGLGGKARAAQSDPADLRGEDLLQAAQ